MLPAHPLRRRAQRRGDRARGRRAAPTTAPLFSPAAVVEVLALPAETVDVCRSEIDTGVPSQLAKVAAEHPGARAVVVEGRYSHVSFLLDPEPVRVGVREVVPPHPAKLLDQAQRVLDVADELPPIVLAPELIELDSLVGDEPVVLVPCRGAGIELEGRETHFLDERPPPRDWALLGCARSRQIHQWFYGRGAHGVDTCPRTIASSDGPLLTKCCLLEDRIELDGDVAVVPWGASLAHVARRWSPSPAARRRQRGRPADRQPGLCPPVGNGRVAGPARRAGALAAVARRPRGVGRGAGRARDHPGVVGGRDRRRGAGREPRPQRRRRRDEAHVALHARPDPCPAATAPRRRRRARLLRRDGAGPHRHVVRADDARRRRPRRPRPRRAPRRDRPPCRSARADGDAWPHPRSAGSADLVRLQAGDVGRRARSPSGTPAGGPATLGDGAARGRGRHARLLRGRRAGVAGGVRPAPRARRPRHRLVHEPRPHRRVRRRDGGDHRHPGPHRQRGDGAPAAGDR